jgi:hypothetical protein
MWLGIGVKIVNWFRSLANGPFGNHATLTNGLVSYWPLSTDGFDSTDTANDLTNNNTVTFVPRGPGGVVAQFTAATSENLSRTAVTGQNADRSIVFWLRAENVTQCGYVSVAVTALDGGPGWLINNTGGADIRLYHNGYKATISATINQWHFVVYTYNAASDAWTFSVDNGTPSTGTSTEASVGFTNLFVGSGYNGYTQGNIARMGWWSTVISASEITSLYNSGAGKAYADLTTAEKVGLVSYWNLSEASGNRADSHGSNTLTDNNTVTSVTNAPANMPGTVANFVALSAQYFSIVENTIWNGDIDTTIAAWVYRNTTGVDVIASRENGATRSILLRGDGGANDASLFTRDYADSVTKSGTLTAATWHLVIAWHDAAGNSIGVQVDDAAAATASTGGVNTTPNGTFALGGRITNSHLDGRMSSPAVWSRVLTAQERADLYAAGAGLFY